jgi:cyclic pyranopterin phosphate synthase
LVSAGLKRVNISLDTLNDSVFQALTRRAGLDRVLAGIAAACSYPELRVRLNALVMRDINFAEILDLVEFSRQRNLALRFIEFMPLDAARSWNRQQMVSGEELRSLLTKRYGDLVPLTRSDPSQPSIDYTFADGQGTVGFIDSVTQPFCTACDRLRLTADGKLRNCLFGREEWDVRPWLSDTSSTESVRQAGIEKVIRDCLVAKRAGHGIDAVNFSPPERAMFQIGG